MADKWRRLPACFGDSLLKPFTLTSLQTPFQTPRERPSLPKAWSR
jgi:hypothetical protein